MFQKAPSSFFRLSNSVIRRGMAPTMHWFLFLLLFPFRWLPFFLCAFVCVDWFVSSFILWLELCFSNRGEVEWGIVLLRSVGTRFFLMFFVSTGLRIWKWGFLLSRFRKGVSFMAKLVAYYISYWAGPRFQCQIALGFFFNRVCTFAVFFFFRWWWTIGRELRSDILNF